MDDGIEVAIRSILTGLTAVTSLVGTRIRAEELDETDDLPGIIVYIDEDQALEDLDGESDCGRATIAIEAVSHRRLLSNQIVAAVKTNGTDPGTGLDKYKGTVDDFEITGCFYLKQMRESESEEDDSDRTRYYTTQLYDVWYQMA